VPSHDVCEGTTIFSEAGATISDCFELPAEGVSKVWMALKGKLFVFPFFKKGHKVTLAHVNAGSGLGPVELESVSVSPRVFKINHFMTDEEVDALLANAKDKMARSTTGREARIDTKRTSDTMWDQTSDTAMKLKRRSFELLGIRPFDNDWADGLQILRYNITGGYNEHLDFFDLGDTADHNYDSSHPDGTNRFATVFLYLSDVEDGGETVFPLGPLADPNVTDFNVDEYLESKGLTAAFEGLQWEKQLIKKCKLHTVGRPKKLGAVLFYSQHPDGRVDRSSLHGACPVISGLKWAANLWVWNGPRSGIGRSKGKGAAHNTLSVGPAEAVTASFSTLDLNAELWWENVNWGRLPALGRAEPTRSNTFAGHQWTVKKDGKVVATWTIAPGGGRNQEFVLQAKDVGMQPEAVL
jgi:prolyl 4-hydroxylase